MPRLSKPPVHQSVREFLHGRFRRLGEFQAALIRDRDFLSSPVQSTSAERFIMGAQDKPGNIPARIQVQDKAWFTTERALRQTERADWTATDPRIQAFAGKTLLALRKRNIPFFAHSAYRTFDDQADLVRRGVSKTRPPVASHVQGKAVDLVHSFYAWELSREEWAVIGRIGKKVAETLKLDVTWGGDWRFYDPAHWELSDWRDTIRVTDIPHGPLHYTPTVLARAWQPSR